MRPPLVQRVPTAATTHRSDRLPMHRSTECSEHSALTLKMTRVYNPANSWKWHHLQ